MNSLANIPVTRLYGVGTVKARAYAAAGVVSVLDLLYHFPRAYEDRSDTLPLSLTSPDRKCAVVMTVATEPKIANIKRGMSLLKFRAFDDSESCEITYFNQNYLKDKFTVGSTFRFYGKVERQKNKYTMSSPAADAYFEERLPPPFFSVYRLSEGLSQKQIQQNVEAALDMADVSLRDPLPESVRLEHRLCTIHYALREIHFPTSYSGLATAKKRFMFDELFFFAAGLSLAGKRDRGNSAPVCADTDISPLLSLLPYELTGAQRRAIGEIAADMKRERPMSRIIIGDVGCGKTVCAMAAMYIAIKNGLQAALMAPTEILATQHYNDLRPLFDALGIRCALLTGSCTPATKRKIHAAMSESDPERRVDAVIGTQALLSEGASFACPGLVITDEQHRFGVNQRSALSEKNKHTHVLVMSATPIPRSLALVMYGDLALSRIDEMPRGRQRVDTFFVDESYRERLDAFIRKNVDGGGQVYVVCPAVEEREAEDGEIDISEIDVFAEELTRKATPPLKAAVQYAEELAARLEGYKVAFVHGKMKAAQKDAVMSSFAAGEVQVLVSTTVIEVGVNVPSASLMIVENAERFGLSQLHQLRGRVGRGDKKSYCILVAGEGDVGETARTRLKTMCHSYDGFEIAEEDLRARGPGDFLAMSGTSSIRQSGDAGFKLALSCDNSTLMTDAFSAAREFIANDPELSTHPPLKEAIERQFATQGDIIS